MTRLGPSVIVKGGVEGVFLAASSKLGIGLFLKVQDGARRARDVAAANLLRMVGIIEPDQEDAFAPFLSQSLRNASNVVVGDLRPGGALLGSDWSLRDSETSRAIL